MNNNIQLRNRQILLSRIQAFRVPLWQFYRVRVLELLASRQRIFPFRRSIRRSIRNQSLFLSENPNLHRRQMDNSFKIVFFSQRNIQSERLHAESFLDRVHRVSQ